MLILASESPRRRQLLADLGFPFAIRKPQVDEMEHPVNGCSVFDIPRKNALLKAVAVADANPNALVVGSDTVIVFNGSMIGKPRDLEDARRILLRLSGAAHHVVTGVALVRRGSHPVEISWEERSEVVFKKLSPRDVERYIEKVNVLDKAGAYAVQEYGSMIISGISGDMNNIIGLPLRRLACEIARHLE